MIYRVSDKGHTVYKLADGTRVPSVSTIINVMDKPAIVMWANRLGLEGIDSTKYVDSLATAGTLAHYLVETDLLGMERDPEYMREFSPIDIDRSETSFVKYLDWKGQHDITLLASELSLVSETLRVGGRCDYIMVYDGLKTLMDLKTCKALFGDADSKFCQLAGYMLLAEEVGYDLDQAAILRVGRDPVEGFEVAIMPKVEIQKKRFLLCRELYEINSQLNRKTK